MKDDLKFEVIDRILTEGEKLGMFWVTILASDLDNYSQEVARILDPVWEREFARHFTPDKFAPGKVNEPESTVKPI